MMFICVPRRGQTYLCCLYSVYTFSVALPESTKRDSFTKGYNIDWDRLETHFRIIQ